MNISLNDSWHAKLYMWTRIQWAYFWHAKKSQVQRDAESDFTYTNLCQYLRVLFLWFPLYVLMQLLLAHLFVYLFFDLPMEYYKAGYYDGFLSIILSYIGGTIGIILLLVVASILGYLFIPFNKIGASIDEWSEKRRLASFEKESKPSLFSLIRQWIEDKHDNLCSTIRLVKENSNAD